MKVGIIGSGDAGRALGRGFVAHGHEAMVGSRDPSQERVVAWVAEAGAGASAGSFAEAAEFGEVAVLATGWEGTENAIRLAGPERLAGKVVIDVTNPLDFSAGMPPTLVLSGDDSGGEQVQQWLQESRVVKAFNIVGNAHMVDADFEGGPPTMFIAGDDPEAKATVTGILDEFGWETVDLGGIDRSRYLEPLAMVWIVHAASGAGIDHAFKLLRK